MMIPRIVPLVPYLVIGLIFSLLLLAMWFLS
jgi:hypothetical protein